MINFQDIKVPPIYSGDVLSSLDPTKIHVPRSILIIGNGFDLDLDIKTSYVQFADSPIWPFKDKSVFDTDSLPFFLNENKERVDTWFDLEELLAKYASTHKDLPKEKVLKAKDDFITLTNALNDYLTNQEEVFVKCMNDAINGHTRRVKPAHRVVDLFLKKEIRSIYSFNFTNTRRIAKQFILKFDDMVNHVHGMTKHDNIILGAGDQRNLNEEFFEFYKSASPLYESNNLVEDLNNADEVFIFGHSLGRNDHDYFSDFFKMICKSVNRPFAPNKIKVRIFTLNDQSEIEIKKQLMTLTNNHLIGLYAHCDFKILKTDLKHQSEWMSDTTVI